MRVGEEGEPGRNGGPRGDLYCYVRIKPHEFLERDGNDLIAGVPISFTQASLVEYVANIDYNTVELVGMVGQTTALDPAWFPAPGG